MYGVDEIKKLIGLVFGGIVCAEKSLADGKVDLKDIAFVVPLVLSVGPVIKDISLLPRELTDLDEAEIDQLVAFIREQLPTVTDKGKALDVANSALDVVAAFASLYQAVHA